MTRQTWKETYRAERVAGKRYWHDTSPEMQSALVTVQSRYGDYFALVHDGALADKLTAKRKADSLLESTIEENQEREKQGFCCLIGDKYNGATYGQGTIETSLASVNDSFHAVREHGNNFARRETYNASK